MSRVDFYFIPAERPQTLPLFACRLLEKAWREQHHIYVHVENAEKAQFLDRLLWTFRNDSFVPHDLYGQSPEPVPPILIGHTPTPQTHNDILLNMHPEIPLFYADFNRILEIVTAAPNMLALSREHRAFYEGKNYAVHLHHL